VQVAVEWAQSVEPVDHDDDELGPDSAGPGDAATLLRAFCDHCFWEGDPGDLKRMVALSPEQAAEADSLTVPR
jgi:hypothetical protein